MNRTQEDAVRKLMKYGLPEVRARQEVNSKSDCEVKAVLDFLFYSGEYIHTNIPVQDKINSV